MYDGKSALINDRDRGCKVSRILNLYNLLLLFQLDNSRPRSANGIFAHNFNSRTWVGQFHTTHDQAPVRVVYALK